MKWKTLLKKTGQNRCGLCGLPVWLEAPKETYTKITETGKRVFQLVRHPCGPSVDHILPRSKGGNSKLKNLRLTHRYCNHRRGNRDDVDFQMAAQHHRKIVCNLVDLGLLTLEEAADYYAA